MPRVCVYVNVGGPRFVMVHPEATGPCGAIVQQVREGAPHQQWHAAPRRTDEGSIVTWQTDNGFWLLVRVDRQPESDRELWQQRLRPILEGEGVPPSVLENLEVHPC